MTAHKQPAISHRASIWGFSACRVAGVVLDVATTAVAFHYHSLILPAMPAARPSQRWREFEALLLGFTKSITATRYNHTEWATGSSGVD